MTSGNPTARGIRKNRAPVRIKAGSHVITSYSIHYTKLYEVIVKRSAGLLGIPTEADGALEIARRSRGTPRIANRLLRRVRDFAEVRGDGVITRALADQALERLEVDQRGFDHMDRLILLTIIDKFAGGPVGLETLAAAVGEET